MWWSLFLTFLRLAQNSRWSVESMSLWLLAVRQHTEIDRQKTQAHKHPKEKKVAMISQLDGLCHCSVVES